MKKGRLIALCMSVVIALPLLSGCGKSKTSTDDKTNTDGKKKECTISMVLCDNPTSPYTDTWEALKWIKEETGVTFDTQVVPVSDYNTKVNMLFNSGNLPDLITHTWPDNSLALSGQLLPINKYMDKLPNLQKLIKEKGFEENWNNLTFSDGNIYLVPYMFHDMTYQAQLWSIRKDIFEKNNIPIPKTLDDIIAAGKKLKEIYPDSTPISNRFGSNNIMAGLAGAYGTIAGYTIGDGSSYNKEKDAYEFAPTSQAWKDMLTTANELYTSGVLDQEYTTLDSVVYEQKITTGETFIIYDGINNLPKYIQEGKKTDPNFDLEVIYPPKGYDNHYALKWNTPWGMGAVMPASLADDPEHLDEVLAYLDWGYSDEAQTLLTFGKEGETFEKKDGVKQFIGTKDYQKDIGVCHNCITLRQDLDYFLAPLSKDQRDLVTKISKECVPKVARTAPLTEKDLDSIQVYQTSLKDYCTSMMEKFVNGSEPLSNWDKFVQQCKDKGCDKMIDVYNTALKAEKK